MLSIKNQNALRALSRPRMINGKENPLFGEVNEPLNDLIKKIMEEEPSKFLTKAELQYRVFIDEPNSAVPFGAVLRPLIRIPKSV